jgi:phospholipid/cholesterol/gamma-HCH transport system substrate-binding protein
MDTDFSRKEKIVGVFVITVGILLVTTVVLIGRGKNWFRDYITFYTVFDESYNLQKNAAVKLYNTEIGQVKGIHLEGDRVKVKLVILAEYATRIRGDAIVTVESPTLIGSEYLAVKPGSKDSYEIPEGGMIRSEKKKSVSDILAEFQVEKTVKMLVEAIQKISEMASRLSDPRGALMTALDNVNRTTAHINGITAHIEGGKGSLGGLVKSDRLLADIHKNLDRVAEILQPIAEATAKAPGAMDQVQDNLAGITRIEDDISASIGKVSPILVQVEQAMAEVNKGLSTLNAILDNAREGSRDIPDITRSTGRGITEVRDAIRNADQVVRAVKKNPLVRGNIDPEPEVEAMDAGLRK